MRQRLSWAQFKITVSVRNLAVQYRETETEYKVWAIEETMKYYCIIDKSDPANTDQTDFETNYKPSANVPIVPLSVDHKKIVRAESRPIGYVTCFTCVGDSDTGISDGQQLYWDFSNDNDLIDTPTGSGIKRKRIEFKFLDTVYIKEGAMYYHNAIKGSYGDVYIVCPSGQYYLDNNGNPQLAIEDTIINHYVIHQFIQGTVAMGDELNTEACSDPVPANYKLWLDITVPESDNISNGWATLEVYRQRTVVL